MIKKSIKAVIKIFSRPVPDMKEKIGLVSREAILRALQQGKQ